MTHSFENLPNKDILIKKLIEMIPQLQKQFQSEDDEEKEWLIQNCSNPLIIDFLQDSTVMMLHVIDAIGQLELMNGTTISKQFGIPKGSVSKITRKLVQQEIIRTEFLPDNKKEVLFLTTPLGKEIFDLHLALHKQMNKGITRFLQRYNTDELLFIIQAFEDTLQASWVHSESVAEKELLTTGASLEPVENDEMSQIVDMLNLLDTRNLKKAKAVLQAMFFTPFD